MPFAAPTMMDDEKQQAQDKNGNQGVNISGQSGDVSTGVPGQDGGGQKTQGSGDKFSNIQDYLSANKQQGADMGQKIQGSVTADAQDAQSKIGSYQQAAPTISSYDPTNAYANAGNLSDADKQAYQTAKQGYQGPTTQEQVAGYGDAQAASSKAATEVANAGTESGQRQLLKSTYARPDYTAGQNALDQTIVQNSDTAKQGFQDLTQKYAGLNDMFSNAAKTVGTQLGQNAQTGLANQAAIGTGEKNAWDGLVNPIQQRADDYNKNTPGDMDRLVQEAQSGNFNGLDFNALSDRGLTAGQNIYDLNLNSYLTPNRTQAGLDNMATSDERNKYAALESLIGDPTRNQITADGQAINPFSFNTTKFDADLAAKKAAANTALAPLQAQLATQQQQLASGYGSGGIDDVELAGTKQANWRADDQARIDATNAQLKALEDQLSANRTIQVSPLSRGPHRGTKGGL